MKIISALIIIMIAVCLFWRFYLPLGGHHSDEDLQRMKLSQNYHDSRFVNQAGTPVKKDIATTVSILRDLFIGNSESRPKKAIPVQLLDKAVILNAEEPKAFWFGHSTLLLAIEGKRLLLDPVFSDTVSPLPLVGSRRYSDIMPISIEELPPIDIVLLSHDHYDHMDYQSIIKLKDKVKWFYVPLGVGSHLRSWGVDEQKIREFDWWDEVDSEGLKLVAAPTRHFAGRKLSDRDESLWCSWVIIADKTRVYFSGDGGYGPHFKEVGEKYGPFALTMMECGQYDKRWHEIHMMPEETVQAHMDVKGDVLLPIHWGAFTLAFNSWTDSVERVTRAGKEHHVKVTTPRIGEMVFIGSDKYPVSEWWK